MLPFSVVMICKNEADVIGDTLKSLEGLNAEVVVYDNGSTDGTQNMVRNYKVQLHEGAWEGYGKTRTKALSLARHDWIFSLDADEVMDEELVQSLTRWQPDDERTVYTISRKHFFREKYLRFGAPGNNKPIRIFNRNHVHWDNAPVHEKLLLPPGTRIKRMKGSLHHMAVKDMEGYKRKLLHYAGLCAVKYFRQGRTGAWFRRKFSPSFTFIKYFILRLGFLEGRNGFNSARLSAWYTAMKYAKLKELYKQPAAGNRQSAPSS